MGYVIKKLISASDITLYPSQSSLIGTTRYIIRWRQYWDKITIKPIDGLYRLEQTTTSRLKEIEYSTGSNYRPTQIYLTLFSLQWVGIDWVLSLALCINHGHRNSLIMKRLWESNWLFEENPKLQNQNMAPISESMIRRRSEHNDGELETLEVRHIRPSRLGMIIRFRKFYLSVTPNFLSRNSKKFDEVENIMRPWCKTMYD